MQLCNYRSECVQGSLRLAMVVRGAAWWRLTGQGFVASHMLHSLTITLCDSRYEKTLSEDIIALLYFLVVLSLSLEGPEYETCKSQ